MAGPHERTRDLSLGAESDSQVTVSKEKGTSSHNTTEMNSGKNEPGRGFFYRTYRQESFGHLDFDLVRPWVENSVPPPWTSDLYN